MRRALVDLAVEQYGKLDIAFNNAGTLGEGGPSTGVSEAGWNDTLAINLDWRVPGRQASDRADGEAGRGIGDLYVDVRGVHGRFPRHGGLRRQQGEA